MDNRKNVKVSTGVKSRLHDLKLHLKVKTESEVIAYMTALYDEMYPKLKVLDHEMILKRSEELNHQESL